MALDGSGCFPSYNHIAEECGLTRRSVIEHVGKAADRGYLAVDLRRRENGTSTSNLYRPTMPGGGEPSSLGSDPSSPGGGEPSSPHLSTHSSNTTSNSPCVPQPETNQKKAPPRAKPLSTLEQALGDCARCPDEWANSVADKHGLDQLTIDREWDKFANHHIGKGSRWADWRRAWLNWCSNVQDFATRGRGPAPQGAGGAGYPSKQAAVFRAVVDERMRARADAGAAGAYGGGEGGPGEGVDPGKALLGTGA